MKLLLEEDDLNEAIGLLMLSRGILGRMTVEMKATPGMWPSGPRFSAEVTIERTDDPKAKATP